MRITRRQLRRIIQEQVKQNSPELQTILDQLGDLSLSDINALWPAIAAVHKQKENELKAGFKKGDRVEFDHEGQTKTGTVARRGGKYVSVTVDGWSGQPWKRWASSLRKV